MTMFQMIMSTGHVFWNFFLIMGNFSCTCMVVKHQHVFIHYDTHHTHYLAVLHHAHPTPGFSPKVINGLICHISHTSLWKGEGKLVWLLNATIRLNFKAFDLGSSSKLTKCSIHCMHEDPPSSAAVWIWNQWWRHVHIKNWGRGHRGVADAEACRRQGKEGEHAHAHLIYEPRQS